MGKKTITVKRRCCRSQPPCKKCPIVVLREVLKEAKAKDAKKARKKQQKDMKKKSERGGSESERAS